MRASRISLPEFPRASVTPPTSRLVLVPASHDFCRRVTLRLFPCPPPAPRRGPRRIQSLTTSPAIGQPWESSASSTHYLVQMGGLPTTGPTVASLVLVSGSLNQPADQVQPASLEQMHWSARGVGAKNRGLKFHQTGISFRTYVDVFSLSWSWEFSLSNAVAKTDYLASSLF